MEVGEKLFQTVRASLLSAWNDVPRNLKMIYVSAALDCVGWSVTAPVLPVLSVCVKEWHVWENLLDS